MSLEAFSERLRNSGAHLGIPIRVESAALNDFMRSLHEAFVKSGRCQTRLLADVHASLGQTSAIHLTSLIDARRPQSSITETLAVGRVSRAIETICADRGIGTREGQELFREFLAAFNQERYEDDGSEVSTTWLLYFGVGDEAAYHFGGLLTGDDGGLVGVAQEYLDWRLKRFCFLVQMWELEKAWDDEEDARHAEHEIFAEDTELDQPSSSCSAEDELTNRNSRSRDIQDQILDATVKALIEMPYEERLSGEDSELKTIWEEICAQVQGEYSFYWDAYVETMRVYLGGCLDERSEAEKAELLPEGTDEEIMEVLMSGLLSRAADYDNDNVSRAICWHSKDDDWGDV